jgi:hypothetical protein
VFGLSFFPSSIGIVVAVSNCHTAGRRETQFHYERELCAYNSQSVKLDRICTTSTTHFIRSEMIVLNSKGSGWNPDVRINYAPDELTRLRTVDSCQPASFLWILCCDRVVKLSRLFIHF